MPAEINNATKQKIDLELISKTAEFFLKKYKLSKKQVSIAFVSDKKMAELNQTYRKKRSTTDVLSFEGEGDFLGEIILNYYQIKRQAKELGNTERYELAFILLHGLLHLIGYDDGSEKSKKIMIEKGEALIHKMKGV